MKNIRETKSWKILGILSIGVCTLLVACAASSLKTESEPFRISSQNLTFRRTSLGIQVEMEHFVIQAMGTSTFCDVTIEEVVDSNGNGKVGDKGDKVKTLVYTRGKFTGMKRTNLTLTVPSNVTRGYLRIRGRKCGSKKGKGPAPVLSVFEVTSSGFGSLRVGPKVPGEGIALLTGTKKPHFLAMGKVSSGREILFRVGDVRSSPSPLLTSLYPGGKVPAGVKKQADFLGALVIIDGLVFLLPGPGIAEIRLPYKKVRLKKFRVLSFDRSFRKIGDWQLDGLGI